MRTSTVATLPLRRLAAMVVAGTSLVGCGGTPSEPDDVPDGAPVLAPLMSVKGAVPAEYKDQYIVVLDESKISDRTAIEGFAASRSRLVRHTYSAALKGFAATLDSAQLVSLRTDPRVRYIQQDGTGSDNTTDTNAGWGVGRIDQRQGPSDRQFTSSWTGAGVNIYIVDGGINVTHPDFGGRATAAATWDANFPAGQDCIGHGTQVASVAAGAEFGVAKGANLRSVRVNGCNGAGSVSDWIWGIDWVAGNRVQPAVMSFSKNMGDFWQGTYYFGGLDAAIRGAKNAGVFVVVAAGNQNKDACGFSPSQVQEVMVVGATDSLDARAMFPDPNAPGSNYGSCIDLFAPGRLLNVALAAGGFGTASGTSLSAPLVAGVAALLYQQYPSDTPDQIHYAIVHGGTSGVVGNAGPSSPNLLVYSTLPAPVTASVLGPSLVGPVMNCTWFADVKAGRGPFTYQWSGVLSGSSNAVSGQVASPGWLNLQVWDAIGGYSSASKWIDVNYNNWQVWCS